MADKDKKKAHGDLALTEKEAEDVVGGRALGKKSRKRKARAKSSAGGGGSLNAKAM